MDLNAFVQLIKQDPENVEFEQTMAVIDAHYEFTPTAFINGDTRNDENQNNGSCKVFAFALLNELAQDETLACFGRYYRQDVLSNPVGDDHQNIRNFMKHGWSGVQFETPALRDRA
ncbi:MULTISPECIES: HopJ type III effector protein [Vibrio]|uniref:Putative type III effector HopPmaJ n=1 Tax=Vibrio proteolyticus NBRC 13287 TaxID=1219065 RepID=U2ZZ83_VIBPR|nr:MULTISPECIES: HopJ type III effector protein [Vibrio]NAW60042.1 type III effector [Vibrio sp. V36_P2S2PM302]NAX26767.1 type III effector [Vibrio sp. V38_P2S17PM301]NAX32477.1 type III effector [Vibrio sp. V37_P2S8PM304]GAD66745.1 putative type III effector HopPmaJ [Vibrio proteolyticus NBRC 13287]